MTKWDYLTASVFRGKVLEVNGEKIGKITLTGADGATLHEFLHMVGQEGWEAIGMSPVIGQVSIDLLVIMKRPIP